MPRRRVAPDHEAAQRTYLELCVELSGAAGQAGEHVVDHGCAGTDPYPAGHCDTVASMTNCDGQGWHHQPEHGRALNPADTSC
jgi:hypothetical protein